MVLNKVEEGLFLVLLGKVSSCSLTMDEQFVMSGLADDCSIDIKPKDKSLSVTAWDKKDYLAQVENHLKDTFT